MKEYYSLNNAQYILSGADLNDYQDFGNFVSSGAPVSATLKNCPVSAAGFVLHVERITGGTAGYCKQRLIYNDLIGHEFWRMLQNGVWGTWGRVKPE